MRASSPSCQDIASCGVTLAILFELSSDRKVVLYCHRSEKRRRSEYDLTKCDDHVLYQMHLHPREGAPITTLPSISVPENEEHFRCAGRTHGATSERARCRDGRSPPTMQREVGVEVVTNQTVPMECRGTQRSPSSCCSRREAVLVWLSRLWQRQVKSIRGARMSQALTIMVA